MAHNARVRPSWAGTTALLPSELEALDEALFKALNADDGGAWAPTDPIEIGGAGVDLQGPNHLVSGHLQVTGTVGITDTSLDYGGAKIFERFVTSAPIRIGSAWADGDDGTYTGLASGGSSLLIPLNEALIHGATLESVKVYWHQATHAGLPTTNPKVYVYRKSYNGTFADLQSAGPADIAVTVGSPAAAIKTILVDQNNVVDRAQYAYLVGIHDEEDGSTAAGNQVIGLGVRFTATSLRQ